MTAETITKVGIAAVPVVRVKVPAGAVTRAGVAAGAVAGAAIFAALVMESAVSVVGEEVALAHLALRYLEKAKLIPWHLCLHQSLILHYLTKTCRAAI